LALLYNTHKKWAFIHIPKTGGTSINKVLLNDENTSFYTAHDSIRAIPDENFFIFTFVRNPYTKFLSAWSAGVRKEQYSNDLDEFIETINLNDTWFLPQTYYIKEGETNTKKVNFIGKYENFKKDCNFIFKQLKINEKISHLNRNPIYDKHPLLNQEQYYLSICKSNKNVTEFIKKTYYNDFKIFNYGMEI